MSIELETFLFEIWRFLGKKKEFDRKNSPEAVAFSATKFQRKNNKRKWKCLQSRNVRTKILKKSLKK